MSTYIIETRTPATDEREAGEWHSDGMGGGQIVRGSEALALAQRVAPLLVFNPQLGWVAGGPGALDRAQRSAPHALWIYGVEATADTVPVEVDGETYRVERGQPTLWIGERDGYRVRLLWSDARRASYIGHEREPSPGRS